MKLQRHLPLPAHVDLVICEKQAMDGDTGQISPGIASHLGFEQLTCVSKIEKIHEKTKVIQVQRYLEDGVEVADTRLPALITLLKGMNKARRSALPGMLRAAKYQPLAWTLADFPELEQLRSGVRGIFPAIAIFGKLRNEDKPSKILQGNQVDEISRLALDIIWETDIPYLKGWLSGMQN